MQSTTSSPEWIGVLRHGSGTFTGWAYRGRSTLGQAAGDTASRLMEHLGVPAKMPAIVADDSAHGLTALPAAILPDAADLAKNPSLNGMEQTAPAAILSPSARLRSAGFLALNPDWDGVVLLVMDGRSHWVHLSAGEAVSMISFLTPMLAANLGAPLGDAVPDIKALTNSQSRPEALAAHLSSADLTGDEAAIAGHLLGAELSASKPYWLGQNLALIADRRSASAYRAALAAQGLTVTETDADAMAQNGFIALHDCLSPVD